MKSVCKRVLTILGAAAAVLCGCAAGGSLPVSGLSEPLPALSTYAAPRQTVVEEVLPDPMTEKYIDVLEGIFFDYALPDGQRLEPLEEDADCPNQFAIVDADGDGEEELLLRYVNAPTAGMFGAVYGYDRENDRLKLQLMEFPSMSFYPNGTVEVGWSHNQGLAGRFWPFTLYRYDAGADVYLPAACVDAWDRECFETDFDGVPFPADADPSGSGIVYYIYLYGVEQMPDPVSQEEFSAWYNDQIGFDPSLHTPGELSLSIPWQPLNETAIEALTHN